MNIGKSKDQSIRLLSNTRSIDSIEYGKYT